MYYVYRITNIVDNKHYYGSRKPKKSIPAFDDLGKYYFSSSRDSKFIQDQKDNPGHYKYKIIVSGLSREKAMAIEKKLHEKYQVDKNPKFYNLHIHNSINFTCTPETGKKISKTHREHSAKKISESHKKRFAQGLASNKGGNNPRFGDHRNYEELHGKEKARQLKEEQSKMRSGAGNSRATTWKFTSPDGKEFIVVGECKKFCKDKNISMRKLKAYLGETITTCDKPYDISKNTVGWKLENLKR